MTIICAFCKNWVIDQRLCSSTTAFDSYKCAIGLKVRRESEPCKQFINKILDKPKTKDDLGL